MRKLVILCLAVGLAGASNFYIFYKQIGANPNCPGFSIDAANNAPSHRKWAMDSTGAFAEDTAKGDWLVRAVLDWTPQDTNASMVWFAANMPNDTMPNVVFQIRAMIRNMGKDTLPVGTPVRLSISGPNSYTYEDTMTTGTKLKHGATWQVSFSPAWHIPGAVGVYNIKVWSEAAGEEWPADDTIAYDLLVDWVQYHTDAQMHWLTWATPQRAVKFNPADFSVPYPVGISRVKADFYLHSSYPWDDSSFTFRIYGGDGQTLLYESETLEAPPGMPGPYRYCDLRSTVVIDSGSFYVSVVPVSTAGYPSSCGDSSVGGHSFYGGPGYWYMWDPDTGSPGGDLFISARVQGNESLSGMARWIGPSAERGTHDRAARPVGLSPDGAVRCVARVEYPPDARLPDDGLLSLDGAASPGVLPFSTEFFPGTTDTLKYDNGSPVRAWCDSVGCGRGVKFISPAESVTLAGALVHFYSNWPTPGDSWASFRVYADDGANGSPGTQLYAVDSFKITRGAWNFVPLAPVAIADRSELEPGRPALKLTNYPNPGAARITLRWQVPGHVPLAVNLYDATGREVLKLYQGDGSASAGRLKLDTRSLAAGIYLVRLETALGSATRKVVVDR